MTSRGRSCRPGRAAWNSSHSELTSALCARIEETCGSANLDALKAPLTTRRSEGRTSVGGGARRPAGSRPPMPPSSAKSTTALWKVCERVRPCHWRVACRPHQGKVRMALRGRSGRPHKTLQPFPGLRTAAVNRATDEIMASPGATRPGAARVSRPPPPPPPPADDGGRVRASRWCAGDGEQCCRTRSCKRLFQAASGGQSTLSRSFVASSNISKCVPCFGCARSRGQNQRDQRRSGSPCARQTRACADASACAARHVRLAAHVLAGPERRHTD